MNKLNNENNSRSIAKPMMAFLIPVFFASVLQSKPMSKLGIIRRIRDKTLTVLKNLLF
jgi:hypothetical protein